MVKHSTQDVTAGNLQYTVRKIVENEVKMELDVPQISINPDLPFHHGENLQIPLTMSPNIESLKESKMKNK